MPYHVSINLISGAPQALKSFVSSVCMLHAPLGCLRQHSRVSEIQNQDTFSVIYCQEPCSCKAKDTPSPLPEIVSKRTGQQYTDHSAPMTCTYWILLVNSHQCQCGLIQSRESLGASGGEQGALVRGAVHRICEWDFGSLLWVERRSVHNCMSFHTRQKKKRSHNSERVLSCIPWAIHWQGS